MSGRKRGMYRKSRNLNTKVKRSVRAISPVIAVLLLIAIVVVAALVAYAWVMSYTTTTTTKAGNAIQIQSLSVDQNNHLLVYVQNVGQGPVTLDTGYVNSNQVAKSLSMPLAKGSTATVPTTYVVTTNAQLAVKIVATDGTFAQFIGPPAYSNVAVTTNQVTFALGTGGASMNPSQTQSYASGTQVAVSAVAADGFQFLSWSSPGIITFDSATSAFTIAHINGGGTITANFIPVLPNQNYPVTFIMGTGGASINPAAGTQSYAGGSSVPIAATAASGYQFSSWTSVGSISFDSASSASTIAHVGSAGSITANFVATQPTQNYQVSWVLGSGGSTINPTGSHTYSGGSSVPILATPATGYQFSYWVASTTSGTITFDSVTSSSTTAHINGAGTVTANFQQIQAGQNYQVTFSTSGGGSSSTTNPSGTQTYTAGLIVPITATPGSGYQFSYWSSTGPITFYSSTSAETDAVINGVGSIIANFIVSSAGQNYQVTFNLGSGGASMNPTGTQTYAGGSAVTVSAVAASGYQFYSWVASGSISFDDAASATTIAHVNSAGSISASFTPIASGQNYQVVFTLGTGGASMNPAGTQIYAAGSTIPITATAASGYQFSGWTSTGTISFDSDSSASTNAHIGSDGSIIANFDPIGSGQNYAVTFALGTGGASMNPTGTQNYADGSTVAVSATPSTGYQFSSWTATGTISFDSTTSASTNAHISSAGTITANFAAINAGSSHQVTIILGSGGSSMTPTPGTYTYADGSTLPLAATAASGYMFSNWIGTGAISFDSASSASTNAHIGSDGSITANFVAINSGQNYQVTFVLGSGGATMSPTGTQSYAGGQSVPIAAIPSTGYMFAGWTSVGTISFDSAMSMSTNAHIGGAGTITANFAAINSGQNYVVTFVLGSGGASISPSGTQSYAGGTVVPITAAPAAGYQFSSWSSSGTITFDSASSVSTNAHIGSAGTVTANFVAIISGQNYQVTFVLGSGGASMNPTGTQSYAGGSTVPISATPSTGYIFSGWTSSGTIAFDNPSSASTNAHVGSDGSITANFAFVKLAYTAGAAQSITVGDVSSAITVQLQDSNGNPVAAVSNLVINLATNPTRSSGTFYNNPGGLGSITSVPIAIGSNFANFYYSDSAAGTANIQASTTASGAYGALSATTAFTINSYQLAFTTGDSQTVSAGSVSSQIRIQSQTASGSSRTPTSSITISLSTTSSGGAFYSDSGGTNAITSVTIGTSSSYSSYFYYKDTTPDSPTLTATTSGYTPATTTFTITGPATKLVFTVGTTQSLYTNTVSSVITVAREDANNNPVTGGGSITVNLAATGTATGAFYSDSGGTTQVTTRTISSGSSSANFYYKATTAGSVTITASSGSLTPATWTTTVTLNYVPNGGFEIDSGWTPTSNGYGYATRYDTDDPIAAHSGSIFAEIDTAYQNGNGYGSLSTTISPATPISSLHSLSIWIYNNGPMAAYGYYSFQITVTGSNGQSLVYWWGNTPATPPTPTANMKVINMGTLPGMLTVGQWVDFSRNINSDWTAQGLSGSASISGITIRGDGYYSGGRQYGEEIFIDDVSIS